jgi:hypothetical protein
MSYSLKELQGEPMTLENSVSVKGRESIRQGSEVLVKISGNRRDKYFRGYTGTTIEGGGEATGGTELYRNQKCFTWRTCGRKERIRIRMF